MASIETRNSKDGRKTSYRVKWRTGGSREGAQDGETFSTLVLAKQFKALVEVHGHHYPPAAALAEHGFAFLVPQGAQASEPSSPSPTFEAYARDYIENLTKPNPETKRKYLERLRIHVFPVIGHRPIAEITRRDMRKWQNGLIEKRLAPKTIQNIRGETLSPIFDAACLPGEDDEPPLREYNPLKGIDLPERVEPQLEIVEDRKEAQILLQAAYKVDSAAADLLLLLISTGMRWGEAAGLPVKAVNFDRGTVSIVQVLRYQCRRWVVVPKPKTKDGYREIPVPPQVMEVIKEHCANRRRDSFVFTAPKGGHWRHDKFYEYRWTKIRDLAEENGLPKRMTMYGLRHSLLTWLASENVSLSALRSIAGHKNVSTTFNIYVHTNRRHHPKVKAAVSELTGFDSRPFAAPIQEKPPAG